MHWNWQVFVVVGGYSQTSTEIYKAGGEGWELVPGSLAHPLRALSGATVDNVLYIAGDLLMGYICFNCGWGK